jgi:hypothetical protein
MNPRVKNVRPIDHYKLKLLFTNGQKGTFDCSTLLDFGVFKALKDMNYFRRVKVMDGTVVWPDHQDICPDTLFLDSSLES